MPGDDTLGDKIAGWIREYAESNGISTLVVGVSGGVDSAVLYSLCDDWDKDNSTQFTD